MTWVAVAIAGSAVLGAGASYAGSEKQAKAAGNASGQTMDMFNMTSSNLQPWLYGGQQALSQLNQGLGLSQFDGQQYLLMNPDVAKDPYFSQHPEEHYRQFGQREGRQAPNMQQGPGFGSLTAPFTLDKFHESPSYQFNLQQGQMAIDKASNARGNLYAPQTLQDLSKYSQGLASNDFNNAFNQYHQQQSQQYGMLSGMSGSGQNAAAGIGGFGANAVNNSGGLLTSGAAAQAGGIMGGANAIGGAGLGLAAYNQYLQGQQDPTYTNAGGGMYGGIPLADLSQYYGYGGGSVPVQRTI